LTSLLCMVHVPCRARMQILSFAPFHELGSRHGAGSHRHELGIVAVQKQERHCRSPTTTRCNSRRRMPAIRLLSGNAWRTSRWLQRSKRTSPLELSVGRAPGRSMHACECAASGVSSKTRAVPQERREPRASTPSPSSWFHGRPIRRSTPVANPGALWTAPAGERSGAPFSPFGHPRSMPLRGIAKSAAARHRLSIPLLLERGSRRGTQRQFKKRFVPRPKGAIGSPVGLQRASGAKTLEHQRRCRAGRPAPECMSPPGAGGGGYGARHLCGEAVPCGALRPSPRG